MIVAQAGIDTWSPAWYVNPESSAGAKVSELATAATSRGRLLPEPIMGHRVGWFPSDGLLYAEGHPGVDRLGCPDDLPAVLDRLEDALETAGVPVPRRERLFATLGASSHGRAGVRRCDATCDLAFDSGVEGLAVLAGVAGLAVPRAQLEVWLQPGGRAIETVYLRGVSGRKVLGRWYDKGVQAGTAARGHLVRPEDQRRWARHSRRDVAELTTGYVRSNFQRRFLPLWQASKGVTVAGPMVIGERVAELVDAGELTHRQAVAIVGQLVMDAAGAGRGPARTQRDRRARARKHGLVLADAITQDVEVNLHAVLEQVLESDAWERRS